jgi:hypothetical protein
MANPRCDNTYIALSSHMTSRFFPFQTAAAGRALLLCGWRREGRRRGRWHHLRDTFPSTIGRDGIMEGQAAVALHAGDRVGKRLEIGDWKLLYLPTYRNLRPRRMPASSSQQQPAALPAALQGWREPNNGRMADNRYDRCAAKMCCRRFPAGYQAEYR